MRPIDQTREQVHRIRIKVQEAGVGLGYLKINRHCKEIPPLNVVTSVLLTHAYTEALAQRLQNESPLRNNREKTVDQLTRGRWVKYSSFQFEL